MKAFVFAAIIGLITYIFTELLAFGAYSVKFGKYQLYYIQHSKLAVLDQAKSAGVYTGDEFQGQDVVMKAVLHPYIGYTIDGKRRRSGCESEVFEECYDRIKIFTDKPMDKRGDKKLVIAILGGSFADAVGREGGKTIEKSLRESPKYRDHEIVIINQASGGYKQPQQLMRLAYAYTLGAEYDYVINIDGFNEGATNFNNYRDRDVHPAFPAAWNHRVKSSMSPEFLELFNAKQQTQNTYTSLANFFLIEGIRYSPFMNFVWRIIEQNFSQRLSAIEQQLAPTGKSENRDFRYEAVGPDYDFVDWDKFHSDAADIWVKSSLAIRLLVEGNGGAYYHFLQPNQYIEGNKTLSEWELRNAIAPEGTYTYGHVYQVSHPTFTEKAKRLTQEGVNYNDMTFAFKDISRTYYVDNCCHINKPGNIDISKQIVKIILENEAPKNTALNN